jgi:hypothetical protein
MDNIQKHNNCINMPSSQIFRSYLQLELFITHLHFRTLRIMCIDFRLDFDQFNIAGPESVNHMCNNDQFIVAGGNPAPPICGINSGNHSKYTA